MELTHAINFVADINECNGDVTTAILNSSSCTMSKLTQAPGVYGGRGV